MSELEASIRARGVIQPINVRPTGEGMYEILAGERRFRASVAVTEKATQVLLGQPKTYPSKMVDSLTTLLAKRSNAKAAFLTLMHDPSHDEKPHLVIGILADGDIEKLIREAGAVAGDTAPDGELVDLVRVVPGEEGLSEYFLREVKPFYERSWGCRLKSFFGRGNA